MSSKNVFKKLFQKKKGDKNKAREGETGDKTAGNLSANLTMASSTNISDIWTTTNSEQGSAKGYEQSATDQVDKNKNDTQDDAEGMKKVVLVSSETTLVHGAAQSQVLNAGRMRDVAYEAVKESLRAVVRCSDVFPPLKSSGQAILEVVERYDAVKEIPVELEQLNGKLRLLVEILETRSRVMNDDRLDGLARTFDEKAKLIAQKLDRSMASRIIETSQDRTFIAREVSSVMFAIEIAMMDVSLRTYKGVSQLQETVSELKVLTLLDKLKYVEGAGFNHEDRQGCTNGTRIMLLADLLAWATDPTQHHIFWLNGMAGTGKTSVAETLCNLLAGRGHLGSSFFCSRKRSDRRNVRLIIPALAKALARRYPEFRTALVEVLKDDLDFTGMGLDDQYLTLILEPAEKAFNGASEPVIIAVDALDECEDSQAAEMFLKAILGQKPLCFLRFFVTSRPEPKIRKAFASGVYSTLRLQDIEQHIVNADIAIFLNNKLKEIDDLYEEYSTTWPPPEVNAIVNQSGNLFIYAATAAKYIADEQGDPVERLSKFASISPPVNAVETIDEVYSFILTEAFSQKLDAQEKDRIRACLSILTCALEPLPISTYACKYQKTDRIMK
ncbi:hypothetical protein D9619_009803 [Psilocybe cf. subviscida]|uniref:NACHT domain-containing protein n=1 Tax=Psilocybe cf. subviscida TaxID=2480587 RepID=A0A8H5BL16_9AGAR|nr:hypothetical protein D9619_009803 [Psilocybe cf. subviscida]